MTPPCDQSSDEEYIVMYWPVEDIAKIAIAAHVRDMKLNDFIILALENYLERGSSTENSDD